MSLLLSRTIAEVPSDSNTIVLTIGGEEVLLHLRRANRRGKAVIEVDAPSSVLIRRAELVHGWLARKLLRQTAPVSA
jgi:hypothetical protein